VTGVRQPRSNPYQTPQHVAAVADATRERMALDSASAWAYRPHYDCYRRRHGQDRQEIHQQQSKRQASEDLAAVPAAKSATASKSAPAAGKYTIEKGIAKPEYGAGPVTPERQAIEAMATGDSFLFEDRSVSKRMRDIIYRVNKASKKQFSMLNLGEGWRVWRMR
jgi:hypothetical protein